MEKESLFYGCKATLQGRQRTGGGKDLTTEYIPTVWRRPTYA